MCTPEVAISLGGLRLCKSVGGAPVARVKKAENYISPFRSDDSEPSFSFTLSRDGRWLWKYFGNGEHGDLIDLVARGANLSKGDAAREIDRKLSLNLWVSPKSRRRVGGASTRFSNIQTRPLTSDVAEQIAKGIGIIGTEGIWNFYNRGLLHVGDCWIASGFRQNDCWLLIDTETKSATARWIDGERIGRLKSVTPKGWKKRPIGLSLIRGSVATNAVIAEGEKLTVYLPAKKGEDQADLLRGKTKNEATKTLFSDLSKK